MFIYPAIIKSSNFSIENNNLYSFSFLGLHQNVVQIIHSFVNITVNTPVVKCALICIKCDVAIQSSLLILIAEGQILSAITLEAINQIQISETNIQFRFVSNRGAGIVHTICDNILIFSIINTTLAGSSLIDSDYNGYIASEMQKDTQLLTISFDVCSHLNYIGQSDFQLIITSTIQTNCQICVNQYVVYGLCLSSLLHGQIQENTISCVFPFIFNGSQCVCAQGSELNISSCVNTINQFTKINSMIVFNSQQINDKLETIEQSILSEIQKLENSTNHQLSDLKNELELEFATNITKIDTKVNISLQIIESKVENSFKEVDIRLFNNITEKTRYLEDQIISNSSNTIQIMNNKMQQIDQYLRANISLNTQQITLTNNQTQYSIVNNISTLKVALQSEIHEIYNDVINNIVRNSTVLEEHTISNFTVLIGMITAQNLSTNSNINALRTEVYKNLTNDVQQINAKIKVDMTNIMNYTDNKIRNTEQYIISNTSEITKYINVTRDSIDLNIINNITTLKNTLQNQISLTQSNIMQSIMNNLTTLEQRIISNASSLQNHITILQNQVKQDLETLTLQTYSNLSTKIDMVIQNSIKTSLDFKQQQFISLYKNSSLIEERIIGNMTSMQLQYQENLTQQLLKINIILQNISLNTGDLNKSQYIVEQLGKFLCSQIQHTKYNKLTGKCECTAQHSQLVGKQCVCTLQNTALTAGNVCACTATHAVLQGTTCVCTLQNTALTAGNVCACTATHAVLQGTTCVCTLQNTALTAGNVCACQLINSHLEGTQCICNQDYVIKNGECKANCPYDGMELVNGVCTCTAKYFQVFPPWTEYPNRQTLDFKYPYFCPQLGQCCASSQILNPIWYCPDHQASQISTFCCGTDQCNIRP
ncbi:Hypothetical_protein [Hexamita inflata]|uniref:Hypothetical_protein n=1 Tax=Hexamita inflata TaxID=28002 RepID=A0AA86P074_9EUKA|nr:Hypothetical protein HINF_LOCUS15716 [Hexamita inflata]